MIKRIIKWIVLSAVIVSIIFIYMLINHPYMVMTMFDGPSQEQVEKEWNQSITPYECYSADCNR